MSEQQPSAAQQVATVEKLARQTGWGVFAWACVGAAAGLAFSLVAAWAFLGDTHNNRQTALVITLFFALIASVALALIASRAADSVARAQLQREALSREAKE